MHLLIDGDVLVYMSSFGAQRNRYTVTYNDGERTFENAKLRDAWLKEQELTPEQYSITKHLDVLDLPAALAICRNKVDELLIKLNATSHHIYLTGKGNFRDEVATLAPYKGNRQDVEKPVHFAAVREWFENHRYSSVTHGQEADDAIGIAQTEHGGKAVVCSIDKDLRQLHGPHYEWHKDLRYNINADASDRWFWLQMLMGDSADNIPGIKGVGDKTAAKLMDGTTDRATRASIVVDRYVRQYEGAASDVMLEVGRLLWIRRAPDQLWNLDGYLDGTLVET